MAASAISAAHLPRPAQVLLRAESSPVLEKDVAVARGAAVAANEYPELVYTLACQRVVAP